jgi:hypothetical protein
MTVKAIALGVVGSGLDVVTVPATGCPAVRFTLQNGLGKVR